MKFNKATKNLNSELNEMKVRNGKVLKESKYESEIMGICQDVSDDGFDDFDDYFSDCLFAVEEFLKSKGEDLYGADNDEYMEVIDSMAEEVWDSLDNSKNSHPSNYID